MLKRMLVFLILSLAFLSLGAEPWAQLKKIYYFQSLQQPEEVRAQLAAIDMEKLNGRRQRERFAARIMELGLLYQEQGDNALARLFLDKAMQISTANWTAWNAVEKMKKTESLINLGLRNGIRQFKDVLEDFSASFLLLVIFAESVFFSFLLLLFIWGFFLFSKYYRLAGHDFIKNEDEVLPPGRLAILALLFAWPMLILSGWAVFPFIVIGLLWHYLAGREKVLTYGIFSCLMLAALFLGLVRSWEKEAGSPAFQTVKKVFSGQTLARGNWGQLDAELQSLLAYSFYARGELEEAGALLSLDQSRPNFEKSFLLGNIAFNLGNHLEAVRFYQEALGHDKNSEKALHNLTVALLRHGDAALFMETGDKYPGIHELRRQATGIKETVPGQRILKKRLLNYSQPRFNLLLTMGRCSREFLATQLPLYLVFFILYTLLVPKFLIFHGRSTFCNKCAKIIHLTSLKQSNFFCEECYQLFLLSDVVFLDAKQIKEKEISRKKTIAASKALLISLLIPGYYFNLTGRSTVFALLSLPFVFFLVFTFFTSRAFFSIFGITPVFLGPMMVLTVFFYLLGNLFSIREVGNGF